MSTRILGAAAAVAALALLTACSDSTSESESDTTTASASATTTESAAAPVTAADLQTQVNVFFDPAVTADTRATVVEDGTDHLAVLEQFTGVLAGYPLTGTVGEVTVVDDDTVTATTEVGGPHGGAPMPLEFTRTDAGEWVLADDSACSILEMGRLSCG